MPISWNEIRQNAIHFASDWAGATSEIAEKQTFWNEFFEVFGMQRRTVASFEKPVKKISGTYGRIDLFWKGMLLVEHKSRGQDLENAEFQAIRYIADLAREGRQEEVPRYIIVSDFARFELHDLEPDDDTGPRIVTTKFALADLHRNIHQFAFIAGYQQHRFKNPDPINLQAVKIMDDLHDTLEAGGYEGHDLERFLVRVLFCLFAQCTGIFEREAFRLFIEDRTKPDGSDLGVHLEQLFAVLNTHAEKRQKNLDETLAAFPYVNGELFAERLSFANFNRDTRNRLLACTLFDWSQISPAVFGSLFQGTMKKKERRQQGSHYTSERDILKVVRGLFLDELRDEFERIKGNKGQLKQFHQRLARLRFLDPACGCGNFLVITYRELRLLEIEILAILEKGQQHLDLQTLSQIDVDAFYGIEIDEWPARIAEVAMWLMDHQMNVRLSEAFGQYFVRLPLRKSPTIMLGNALRLDWQEILPPEQCSYVLGNPPFVGKQFATAEQKADMDLVCGKVKGYGVLDYVTAWYFQAARYIAGTRIVVSFVSTNSIAQGEQVCVLWQELFKTHHIKIHFAHRTFAWESEARGKAHVHVVIIGFAAFDSTNKRIYDYESSGEEATASSAANISPYLVAGNDIAIVPRSRPICAVPEIVFGSMPNDGGHLLFDASGRADLLKRQPDAARYLRRFVGADEFLNGSERWCLWLDGENSAEFMRMSAVKDCVHAVAMHRQNSKRQTTKELADTPACFGEIRQPDRKYLLIPSVSSERRRYIPIGFMRPDVIASNLVLVIPGADLYQFGVLSSAMHMAWVRQVCGRMKSDLRYSNRIVYNNYPWPVEPTAAQRSRVEEAAQRILDLRVELGDGRVGFLPAAKKSSQTACLADLYDREGMPRPLVKAHHDLDRAVDRCYRSQPFTSDRQRVEFLFALYEKIASPLLSKPRRKKS
jgi:hypothetical protein